MVDEADDSLMVDDNAGEDFFGANDLATAHKSNPPKTADLNSKRKTNGSVELEENNREPGADVKSLLARIKKLERTVFEVSSRPSRVHWSQPALPKFVLLDLS